MKTLNKTLIVPLLTTLILTGCMPDSLTKFKKDPPKKADTSTNTGGTGGTGGNNGPVTGDDGSPLTFTPPTFFSFGNDANLPQYSPTGTAINISAITDGSLADPTVEQKFFERCDLVTSGVNPEATSLPTGISFSSSECAFTGTPTVPKSVVTAFCSDGTSATQAICEANPLVWNSTTNECSLNLQKYGTQTLCEAGFHKWYPVGGVLPYKVKMTYHNAEGTQKTMFANFLLGVYRPLTTLNYTQSGKILIKTSSDATNATFNAIVPLLTTSATTGAYARKNTLATSDGVIGVAKYVDANQFFIGVNKLVPIKVASTSPFLVNTFITKAGDATKIGKIFKIDSASRILYVENISANNKYFVKNESICSNSITGSCGVSYTITDINESYVFKKTVSVDNDNQFYAEKFKINTPINVFEVGSTIKELTPIASNEISATNGLSFSVSPALPCNDPNDPMDCISLDSETGHISGTFSSSLPNTEFTFTVTNPIGSTSVAVNLSAIIAPNHLTETNKQIITVSSTSMFKEGENLIQPLSPPLVDALSAKIIKVLNAHQLAIETFNGAFLPGASLDNNGSAYQAEKAFIIPFSSCTNTNYTDKASCEADGSSWSASSAIHYNVAVTTSNSGDYTEGDFITSTAGDGTGAFGRVMHVETAARDVLYVQYLTQSATSPTGAKTFYEADTLNSGATVYQVQNSTMNVTLASAASFVKGSDIVTSSSVSAYTNAVSGSVLSLSEISKLSSATFFKIGQTLYNHETQALSTANSTISKVTHMNYFIFERGKKMFLNGNLAVGNGVIYSISPALPSGLTLDTSNGNISGVAVNSSVKKDYLITATNFIGSTSYAVAIEVKDFFEIIEKTGASSANLHKVGDYESNRKCRVDASDILAMSNGKSLDIRCFLDMEEQDVFQTNIKLNLFTGAGICQYIRYEPYYFNAWQPHKTANISTRYQAPAVIRSGCDNMPNTGSMPTADMCEGNYSYYNSRFPNCDEGSLLYYTEVYVQDTGSGTCVRTERKANYLKCGGKASSCIAGPVTDIINPVNLETGKRNEIIPTSSGINYTYSHASPISKGDAPINVRTANGTINNQCSSSAADTLLWRNTTRALASIETPMGADSNPFYTVTCLDAAYDIKARIRVVVRDWDKSFRIDDDIWNQSFLTPAANMNNNTLDPIFNKNYNDIADWDDDYLGGASTFTPNTCGAQDTGFGYCSNISGLFQSDADCTAIGGSVISSGSCSAGGSTSYVACVGSGVCSDGAYTDAGSCGKAEELWTPYTWTPGVCTFNNQAQCEHYGGTWTGDEQYKFPNTYPSIYLGN